MAISDPARNLQATSGEGSMRKSNGREAAPVVCERSLADVGELAGPLTHEVNDLLNNLTLHLAVIQHMAAGELTGELREVRRQITHVAALVAGWQRRRRRQTAPEPVDVNEALWDAFLELRAHPDELHVMGLQEVVPGQERVLDRGILGIVLDRANDLPSVIGNLADMRRLFRFLLSNAARSVPSGGVHVWARTRMLPESGHVEVTIEDSGSPVAADLLFGIFQAGHEPREGMDCLELAACRSIVRRLGGTMDAHLPPDGGLAIRVGFPATL
jgi:C4-dicarboxylate-specific signal transduction histidine kinase